MKLFIFSLFIIFALSSQISVEEFATFRDHANDKLHPYCPTDDLWDWKLKRMNHNFSADECPHYSVCDDPTVREKYVTAKVTVSLAVVVLCVDVSKGDCVTKQEHIQGQYNQLVVDFASAGISFSLDETMFINSKYATIAAYSNTNPKWYNDLMNLKYSYAYNPDQHINVFVTNQIQGNQGTLLGIGTFPWDEDFLSSYGGLWVNALYFGAKHKTLSHEFGHNLGLWHTFHGINEVESCQDPCLETPHAADDYNANYIGDRCADTASTPMNYECKNPTTNAPCTNKPYGETNLDNLMAYTPDDCMNRISNNQAARAKCYLCRETPSILSDASGCPKV